MTTDGRFFIGAEARSADGVTLGRLIRAIVDPVSKTLTRLVVEPGRGQGAVRAWCLAVALAAGGLAAVAASPVTVRAQAAGCPWVGSTAPVEQRVAQVMAQITQGEEIALVHGVSGPYIGDLPGNARLCIPALRLQDGPAGAGDGFFGVTQLPAPVAAAATWDPAAAGQYGTVLGAEQVGKGVDVVLGPTLNVVRDPRWGRDSETNGEDPFLAGSVGAAYIRGIQAQGVMAQAKHFAVYNQEANRTTSDDNAIVSERTMQEIYMPQFQAAVNAGVASAMCSYNLVGGAFACDNGYLLATALKSEFGFRGFITSDWYAMHSTILSAAHGLDMEMPDGYYFGSALDAAVTNGQVAKSRLDDMVRRILREMFDFGLFDHSPVGDPNATVTTPAHADTAKQISEEGTVLLKNSGGILPLSTSSVHSIAVIGDSGGSDAISGGGGSAIVNPPYVVTPFQGITARAGSGVSVTYNQGPAPNGALPAVPSSALAVTGSYYPNMTLSGSPALTRRDPDIDFNWHGSPPGTGIGGTAWSAKWVGTVTPPVSGTYTFSVTSDDGSRMLVDGAKIIDNWSDHGSSTVTGTVNLTAGRATPIEVDYYQHLGLSNVTLGWQPPGSDPITDAANAARSADVAVVFASCYEGEGADLPSITLPGQQDKLISAVAAANPRTVVVLNTGSAVTMPWLDQVAGVFEAWYPGQEDGNAIAALLFGDVNPSGKLPVTFPVSLSDVPAATAAQWPGTNGTVQYSEGVDVGYRWYDAKNITPLFPFGFGLSYTTFGFSDLTVSGPDGSGGIAVSARVTNTGSVAGSDVAQLYVADPASTGEPPKQLKGFQRVTLNPGASTTVTFTIGTHDLAYWNDSSHGWTTPAGSYGLLVGDSSRNLPLRATITESATTAPHTGPITGIAGLCIDDKWGATVDENPIWTYGCNGTGAQQWTVTSDHRLTVLGKCMDVRWGGTTNGSQVELYDCNGSGAQIWEPQAGGALLNPQSGRCLDDPNASTAWQTQLQIYDCNGTAAQTWRLP